ncbi:MAG: biotin/lipoyl-binding protein [Oscillospiraceae bacterium]|nr:biotin/lipoyl-binding protein [Oscillospiraceae bacterium]
MKYRVTLNDKIYEVEVENGEAMLLDEYVLEAPAAPAPVVAPVAAPVAAPAAAPAAPAAPAAAPVAAAGEQIICPMPGVIVKMNVKAGQAVKSGEVMAILEAMKMENEIMAPRDATVVQVLVNQGDKVDTGAPLIVLG